MNPNLRPILFFFFFFEKAYILVKFQKKSLIFFFFTRLLTMLVKVEQALLTLFKASAAQVATKYSRALTRTACRILVLFNLNTNPSLGFHPTTRLNVSEILIRSQAPHLTQLQICQNPKIYFKYTT